MCDLCLVTCALRGLCASADHTGNPSGPLLFCAIRGQDIEMHGRAQTGGVNVAFGNAGEHELIAAGSYQIEPQPWLFPAGHRGGKRSARWRWRVKPAIDQVSRVTRRRKRVDQLSSHLVATRADTRADGDMDIGRPAAEFARQRINRRAYR